MKAVAVLVLLVVAVAFSEAARIRRDEAKYTTKYDNINLDDILKSDRLLDSYHNCLMDRGRCTAEAEELKKALPDALENECEKCSEKQREGTKKVLRFVIRNKTKQWEELISKYDPEGKYKVKYEEKYKHELDN